MRASKLLSELAGGEFDVCDVLNYTTRNRYMSYERRNGANVNREYALILEKKTKAKNRKNPPSPNGQMHQ